MKGKNTVSDLETSQSGPSQNTGIERSAPQRAAKQASRWRLLLHKMLTPHFCTRSPSNQNQEESLIEEQAHQPVSSSFDGGRNVVGQRGARHPILLQLGSHKLERGIVAQGFQAGPNTQARIPKIPHQDEENDALALHGVAKGTRRVEPGQAVGGDSIG